MVLKGFQLSLIASLSVIMITVPSPASSAEVALPELVRSALAFHPAVRGSQGRQRAAEAGVDAARWRFWPTPSISVQKADTFLGDSSYSGDSMLATVRLQQPLWTGGRLTKNLSRAEALASVADAELEETRQQLTLRVIQAWSDALVAEHKVRAYENSRAVHQRLLDLVRRRSDEGVSARADVALANSRLSTLQAELDAVTAQRDTALDRLRSLTGQPLNRAVMPEAESLSLPDREQSLSALLESAFELSPQLARVRSQSDAADASVGIARAALTPEVSFTMERQLGDLQDNGQPPQNRAFVAVSYALDGGLASISGVSAAMAEYEAALEDQQAQKLAIEEQIRADFALAQVAQSRRGGLEVARQSAGEVSVSYERQFLAGRKQWQDLMNAAREQAQSDVQLADALGAEQLSNWRLAVLSKGVETVFGGATQPVTPGFGGMRP